MDILAEGGSGSGNFDHAGRPGEIGGSAPGSYRADKTKLQKLRIGAASMGGGHAKTFITAKLEGTEKQVKWAHSIRNEFAVKVADWHYKVKYATLKGQTENRPVLKRGYKILRTKSSSSYWIDTRSNTAIDRIKLGESNLILTREAEMPYTSNSAPDWVKELPAKLKDAWIAAFNAAFEEYKDDGKASAVANAQLSKMGEKKDGKWIMKEGKSALIEDFAGESKPVKITESCQLLEAKDDTGWTWRVQLIRAGTSHNRTHYPAETLREAVPLYNGVRAMVRSDAEHLRDENLNPKNVAGWYENAEYNESAKAVHADFNITEDHSWLRDKILSASKRNKMDIIGFSHVAEGVGHVKKFGENLVRWVDRIVKVNSVDVVVNPSAGGQLLKMVAGKNVNEEREMIMLEKLLKLLEAVAPLEFAKLDKENPDPDKVVEALKNAMVPWEKIAEAMKPMKKQDDPPPTEKKVDDPRKAVQELTCRTILAEAMADSKLPPATKDKVKKQFKNRIFAEAELSEALKAEEEYLGSLQKTYGTANGFGDQSRDSKVQKDEADKLIEAFDGFFQDKDINKTPRFWSIREAYRKITGDENFTGRLSEAKGLSRFAESIDQTVWPQVVENAVNKAMLAEFQQLGWNEWRKIVQVVPLSDLRLQTRVRLGGYGSLPAVLEGAPYQPLTSPADEKESYTPSKRGGTEDLTMETIVNDDVGAALRVPSSLAYAAKRTLYEFVFDMLDTNAVMGDQIALFHASSHGANLGTTALSAAALTAARLIMVKQAELTSSKRLAILPRYLLHPTDLHSTVHTLLDTEFKVGSTNNDINIVRKYNLEPVEVLHWTDADNWYLIADPNNCPTIEVGFFQNKQEPELFLQDMPTVGSMFNADKLTYKIRHIYGGAPVEWRGMYRSTVT